MNAPVWRKPSRSGTGGSGGQNCVEVAKFPGAVGVRDSKNPGAGSLTLSAASFARLLDRVKRDGL